MKSSKGGKFCDKKVETKTNLIYQSKLERWWRGELLKALVLITVWQCVKSSRRPLSSKETYIFSYNCLPEAKVSSRKMSFHGRGLERDESKTEDKLFSPLFRVEIEWRGRNNGKVFSPFSEDNKSQTFSGRSFLIVHQSVLQSNFDLT